MTYHNAKISSFYATQNERVSFIKITGEKSSGQVMLTTQYEEISGQQHEELVNELIVIINGILSKHKGVQNEQA